VTLASERAASSRSLGSASWSLWDSFKGSGRDTLPSPSPPHNNDQPAPTPQPLPVTVFTPDSSLASPAKMLREMWRDLLASRELAWRLAVRDISAQYRQAFLGILWAFILPLVEPGPLSLAPYRPRQGYLVLDERRLAAESSAPERNLSAALFRLEASCGPADVMAIVQQLLDWLQAPEQTGLRRAFAVWFGRVFLPRHLPSVSMPPMTDLFEVQHMLNDGIETWTDQWKKEGLQEGLKQGEARILLRLLSVRFGALPPEIRQKIETADAETLLQWSERILDAESLDDVVH
jgi:hypothetical protein